MYIFVYIFFICAYTAFTIIMLLVIHHHYTNFMSLQPGGTVCLHQGAIRILRLVGAWSLQTCQRRWVGWSYGLSHMACTLKGLERSMKLIWFFPYVSIPWVLSGVVAKENPSPFRDFLFGDEVRTLHLGWKHHSLRSCFDLQNWTHSTRGSWMTSV